MRTPSSTAAALAALALFTTTAGLSAAPFTSGNLAVYRVGTGAASLTSAAVAVFVDEYTTAGTFVQSIALPTSASGANQSLVAAGSATSEGLITRSVDGRFLLLTGYASVPGTASIAGTTSATVARVVGRIDSAGVVDTTTALTDFSTASNPRSAVSTNGTDLWVTGGDGGARYTTLGATTSTQLATTPTNLRQARLFGGQLYSTTASGAFRLVSIGSGTPTTTGQTVTSLPGFPTSGGSPYGFFFADLDAGVAGVDTVYVADDTAGVGIQKYSLVGGSWVANGNLVTPGIRGLTGVVSGTSVTLYGATAVTLVKVTDTAGYNAPNNGTVATLATAAAKTAFRGVDFAPLAPSPREIWRVAKFGPGATNTGATADEADFDNDGVTNIMEYAFGLDPTTGADGPAGLPSMDTVAADPLLTGRLSITFTVPSPAPPDVLYFVDRSDNLTGWQHLAAKFGTADWTWIDVHFSPRRIIETTSGAATTTEVGNSFSFADPLVARHALRVTILY